MTLKKEYSEANLFLTYSGLNIIKMLFHCFVENIFLLNSNLAFSCESLFNIKSGSSDNIKITFSEK